MPGAQSRGLRDITLTFDENMKEVVSLMGESPVFERVSVFSFWIGHCQASVLLLIGVYTNGITRALAYSEKIIGGPMLGLCAPVSSAIVFPVRALPIDADDECRGHCAPLL
ncbi:hypothetical protein KDX30_19395 [Pseudomonas sp. CDFA 553]|uniref:hypothetical protein n=1 Tax=Pseudomonas quasicaspiana TaxID=2829821 RepID=UPI001E60C32A|nr:hypothetical protein [Pseudomonas quasicaspiana]MCD5990060.1 hypothetical protein [Pseudomonas quasicaspiana]